MKKLLCLSKIIQAVYTRASAAEGRRAVPSPWIFIHGTDIVVRGLIVLFFGLFSVTANGSLLPQHLR